MMKMINQLIKYQIEKPHVMFWFWYLKKKTQSILQPNSNNHLIPSQITKNLKIWNFWKKNDLAANVNICSGCCNQSGNIKESIQSTSFGSGADTKKTDKPKTWQNFKKDNKLHTHPWILLKFIPIHFIPQIPIHQWQMLLKWFDIVHQKSWFFFDMISKWCNLFSSRLSTKQSSHW